MFEFCSITGADDAVDPVRLGEISAAYPFVEWALLYSPGERGAPRYPSKEWIAGFHKICPSASKAMHLCKEGLSAFIEGDRDIFAEIAHFPRVQLNFGFMFDMIAVDRNALAERVASFPQIQFIFQYSERTRHLLSAFDGLTNVSVLMDASAGRGECPDGWPVPLAGYRCGYAGGIGPDNIGHVLDSISSLTAPDTPTWIDMETRVRTDNRLDFTKVFIVLEAVKLSGQRATRQLINSSQLLQHGMSQ